MLSREARLSSVHVAGPDFSPSQQIKAATVMCGIVGLATSPATNDTNRARNFREAVQSIAHRGPDGQGQYDDGDIWFGHNRLSILDLSDAGSQPMQSADERFVITYNGEVYNFRELAAAAGLDRLRSGSDTEVVLELFASQGVRAFAELNGIFAFAVYDRHLKKLWLVRDRLGVKPLYFRIDATNVAFASEVKGIIAVLDQPQVCNLAAMHEWLYFGNPLGDRTLYDGISQVLPGHYLEIDLESFKYSAHSYWSLQQQAASSKLHSVSKKVAISETRRLLEHAVQRQLVSDVPVAVFLSGGVDSSAIAAFASRHYEGRLATYSVGFDFSTDGGELPKAKRIAELFGTDHHEIQIAGGDVGDLVERMVRHHDMPFSDAANIPLYLMAAQISEHTKVVLQGDGGDELFGGYRRYTTLKYYRLLRSLVKLAQHIQRLTPKSVMHYRIRRYLSAFAAEDLATTIALLLTSEDRESMPLDIFTRDYAESIGGAADSFARYRELQSIFQHHDISNQLSLIDLSVVLPDTYLEKVDRSTMAAGLEVRVPFLDNDLVDYVVGLPGRRKIPFGKKKWLLKAALRGTVPDDILFAPKAGFGVPFGNWLQTSLKPLFFDHLNQFERSRPGLLNTPHIRNLFERTRTGQQNHSPLLWKVLNFTVWANRTNIEFRCNGVA